MPDLTVIHGGAEEETPNPISMLLEKYCPDELAMLAEALGTLTDREILTVDEARVILGLE